MLSYFKLATAALLTFGTLGFAQDVTLTIDGTSLNYESTADIYGFQFSHDGCAIGANGGDAAANGFMISASSGIVLGFSMSGGFIPAGSGTLVDLGGECSTVTDLVFSGANGVPLLAELSEGGGDPVLPTVSILSPADGSSFDDVTSVDVEASCSDCGDGDHYHTYLDGFMQGMFYEDNFSVNVGYGDHTLTVTLADAGHQVYDHEGSSASVSFSVLETSAGGCDDPSACNDGDPDNDCTYPEENYDCDGICLLEVDCDGVCGGSNGAFLQDCWFDGDGDGCYETLDTMTTCSCEWEGGSSTGGDCGPDTSNVDVLYCSDADIYGFQFNVDGVTVVAVGGGAAETAGFTVSTGNNTVLGFSFSGTFIPGNMCDILTTLEVEGDASAACLSDLVLSGENGTNLGGEITDCLTVTYSAPCDDVDADGICDDVDDCVGELDECGECNGDGIDPGACDCAGNVEDCAGVCGGDGNCIEISFGAIADGTMEIIMNNTMPIAGFQFNVTGTDLDGAFGGSAAGAGFQVNTGVDGIVLGFSMTGGQIPAGSGVLTNLNYTALADQACITNEIFALGDWEGGFYEINIGDCAALDYSCPDDDADGICDDVDDCVGAYDECGVCNGSGASVECEDGSLVCDASDCPVSTSSADVLYDSESDIAGFQFHVDGDLTLINYSGGAAVAAGFMISLNGETNMVIGFSLDGSVVLAGSGTLLTLEYEGDGSPCLSDLVLSDPDANGLDATVEDCLTISYEAPCDDADADGICDDVDDCVGAYDCAGECNGTAVEDDCGVCDGGNADMDCAGVCGGSAVEDDCGVCDGGNADMDCAGVCGGSAVEDCAGVCGGSTVEDECGVCGGDGSSCAPGVYGLALNADGNLDVTFDSPDDIYGFQFLVTGVTVTGAGGGDADASGFSVSTGNNTVLGFSFSGSFIPAGSGVLTVLSFEGSGEACLSDIVVSGAGGEGLDTASGDCVTIEDCDDVDADGICDDVDDCVGAYDECGVCNGSGIADGTCDCAGNIEDCAGVCGGTAVVDECGECGGDGIADGTCDCDGNVEDCNGDCGGTAEVDECGECGGDGIDEGACDCAGSVEDCAGECGGTAENCPDWVDCPSCYENTASMTAIVLDALSGDQMYADGDILAAFDDAGNNRGIAILLYPIPFGPYEGTGLYEIQIRGDAAGDAISFKYYDASEDEVLDSGTGYTFVIDDIIGDVVIPHEISVGAITLSIDIASGWNWFSLNVEGDMSIGSVMASLTSTDGDFIKSASASSTYYPDFGWYGGLDELGVIGMYKFNSANADLLVFSGAPVDPLSTPIDLASGWNWLGFTPQNDGATADALVSITTNEGDFIKNQGASSTYYSDFGWYGGLEVMAPTEGYMLSVAEGSTLTYPNFGVDDALTRERSDKELPVAVSDWEVNYHDYEFNGHITMSIDSREDSDGDYIAVFVGDECRGLAERMYFPFGDSYMYSVMVYSNKTDGEELTFKYYDSAKGDIVEYSETLPFKNNMIENDGFNTFGLSREGSFSQPKAYGISEAYPNPFNPVTSFEYTLEKDGMVQVAIYDINGRMVSELVNGYQSAGSYPVVWDAQELSSGVYLVNMISGDYSTIQKVMLIK